MSLVGLDRAGELALLELGSYSDATCEKLYKSLACCFKQTQKLTVSDSWWGITPNWMMTQTQYPGGLPCVSHTCFGQNVSYFFHYMRGKCHHCRTGGFLGWERMENTIGAAWHPLFTLLWGDSVGSSEELTQPINSSLWHCMSRNYRTDV